MLDENQIIRGFAKDWMFLKKQLMYPCPSENIDVIIGIQSSSDTDKWND